MFDYGVRYENYCYTYKDILDNGQTIEFIFWAWDNNVFSVQMEIYSKRKKKSAQFLEATGKCGLQGLILARLVLKCFIEFLEETTPIGTTKYIMITGSDNRRMRIYKHFLTKLGFEYTRTKFKFMGMCRDVEGKKVPIVY